MSSLSKEKLNIDSNLFISISSVALYYMKK